MKNALKFIKQYGGLIPGIPFQGVALHPLADDIELLKKLAMMPNECTYCDIYWAYQGEVFLVSLKSSSTDKPLVTYHLKDKSQAGHRFYVITNQCPISAKEVSNTLRRLVDWLNDNKEVFQRTYVPENVVEISDKDWTAEIVL